MSDREIQALRRELAADPTDDAARQRLVGAERRAGLHHEPLRAFGGALAALLRERRGEVEVESLGVEGLEERDRRWVAPWCEYGPSPRVGMFVTISTDGSAWGITGAPRHTRVDGIVSRILRLPFNPLDPDGTGELAMREGLAAIREMDDLLLRRALWGIDGVVGFGLSRTRTDPRGGSRP